MGDVLSGDHVAMIQLIYVEPANGGWSVRSAAIENEQMFRSGAKAEASAKTLAEALSQNGVVAEIRIHLRDGSMAGRFVCPASHPQALAGG